MDVNDDFCLEEDLYGSEDRRESAGEWSSVMPQEAAAKQTRKRRREPTMKIEEMKKTAPSEKAGEDLQGGSGPCICTMRTTASCGAALHLWLLLQLEKRGTMLCA